MKKKNNASENYLERVPVRVASLKWTTDADGMVTFEIENTGWVNRLAQRCFGRPRVSYVHLDKLGSFVWPLLDGTKTITELGQLVDEHFGEEAHPLYERLARYFQILESYHYVEWVE